MLNDPITLNSGANYGAPTGGVAAPYGRTNRQTNGFTVYQCASGAYSSDQQSRLYIRSNPRVGAPSTAEVKIERDKNVAAIAGVPQKDATASARVIVSGDLQHFTPQELWFLVVNACEPLRLNADAIIAGGQS